MPCEICEYPAVDIMHIEPKGTNPHLKDDIFNLMAGCRSCHETSANEKERLKTIHLKFMLANQKEKTEKLLDEK